MPPPQPPTKVTPGEAQRTVRTPPHPTATASERRLKDATKTRGRRSARERDLPSEASEEEAEAPREDEGAVGVRAVLVPNASGGNERLSLGRTRAVVCQRGKEEGKEQPQYRGLSSRG
ncbi:unnamed protein product [Lampetra fluviatilis]